MSLKKNMKLILLIVVLAVIVGTLTLASGMLAKLFGQASHCDESKMLLFVSGMILALIVAGLGALYNKYQNEAKMKEWKQKVEDWINKEQFRYRQEKTIETSGSLGAAEEQYRYGCNFYGTDNTCMG